MAKILLWALLSASYGTFVVFFVSRFICVDRSLLFYHPDDFGLELVKFLSQLRGLGFQRGYHTPVFFEPDLKDGQFLLGEAFVELEKDQLLALGGQEAIDLLVRQFAVLRKL